MPKPTPRDQAIEAAAGDIRYVAPSCSMCGVEYSEYEGPCQEPACRGTVAVQPASIAAAVLNRSEVRQYFEARYREALEEAHHAIKETAKVLIVLEGTLKQPYPEDARWSPWTRFVARNERSPWTLLCKADTTLTAALKASEETPTEGERHDD